MAMVVCAEKERKETEEKDAWEEQDECAPTH